MCSAVVSGQAAPGNAVFDESQVQLFHSRRTAAYLHKFGPGPRIHINVGMFDVGSAPNTSVAQQVLQRRIVASQEAMLHYAATSWDVGADPPVRVLDIGCGVGGGSIYWAQEYGARVTGLTVTAEHVPVMEDFVRQAGVTGQVTAVLGNIHDLNEAQAYDFAVAIGSSLYMDRTRLFAVVARALKPGCLFGIEDTFMCRPEGAKIVDGHCRSRLGTLADYVSAAHAAGFELEQDEDITDRVYEWWMQSVAWTTAELDRIERTGTASPNARDWLVESALAHGTFFRIWRDHAVENRLLLFRLRGADG